MSNTRHTRKPTCPVDLAYTPNATHSWVPVPHEPKQMCTRCGKTRSVRHA